MGVKSLSLSLERGSYAVRRRKRRRRSTTNSPPTSSHLLHSDEKSLQAKHVGDFLMNGWSPDVTKRNGRTCGKEKKIILPPLYLGFFFLFFRGNKRREKTFFSPQKEVCMNFDCTHCSFPSKKEFSLLFHLRLEGGKES